MNRQLQVAKEGINFNPLVIFPEGTTTNGTGVMEFKKGAFFAELPVMPVYVKLHRFGPVNYADDITEAFQTVSLYMSSLTLSHLELHVMPIFRPNDYLFKAYLQELDTFGEMARWKVYAEAVRDVICERGNLHKEQVSHREKIAYGEYMQCQTDEQPESLFGKAGNAFA
jgi:lysophosphatidylcholine acyltransferase/lyso-PAF acetyltransferase